MEQIQIRQPKMPAAQSFIQILETFLANISNFITSYFSYKKLESLIIKRLKALVSQDLSFRNPTSFFKEKTSKWNKVKKLGYLLCFINFQIYFLLITWKSIICILKSRKIWFSNYKAFSLKRFMYCADGWKSSN